LESVSTYERWPCQWLPTKFSSNLSFFPESSLPVPLLRLELPTFKPFNLTSSAANYLHSGAVASPHAGTLVECSNLNVQLLVCICSFWHLGTDFADNHDINGSCSCAHERVGLATDTDCWTVAAAWYFSATSSVQTSEAELPYLHKSFRKHLFHHLSTKKIVNFVPSIPWLPPPPFWFSVQALPLVLFKRIIFCSGGIGWICIVSMFIFR